MPRWTPSELLEYEQRRNSTRRLSPRPEPEPIVRHEPLAAPQGAAGNTTRCLVSIESRRKKLCDCDNLAGGCKAFIDCLRYGQLIKDDSPEHIELKITQTKVASKEEECTVITIEQL